jgi:hypothetical protein
VVQEIEGEASWKEAAAQERADAVTPEGEVFACMRVHMATLGEVSLQEEVAAQVVDASKEVAAQEGADSIPVEGEVSVHVRACMATLGEVSACNVSHETALSSQRAGILSLAQAPLDSNPVVTPGIIMAWGGEGE